ncbi:hypothetical protein [Actinokineospora sp. UTMC 2448]|uniref:hypothetical protein n=1 Tax=Actinokineospora sp. UTMC 2448 TaxID=2268449 RepID=UPI00216446BB|nr:hypothetical protein [Actinokineospora sp. UTMC 2448]
MQFKYGALTLARYRVGEAISWDGAFVEGEAGHGRVGVEGLGQPCPKCKYDDDLVYDIVIEGDVIRSVALSGGVIDYLAQGRPYWVVLS